jgi:hypothetical protein
LPEELLLLENPDTHEKIRMRPGELRTGDVAVGRHVPPSAAALLIIQLRTPMPSHPAYVSE